MKLLILLNFVLIFNFCESRTWKIRFNKDLDELDDYFDQASYDDVTYLDIRPEEDYTPNHKETVRFNFLKKFRNLEEFRIVGFNFATFEPIEAGRKFKILYLYNNKIKKLHPDQLKKLRNLEQLSLEKNEIKTLCSGYLHNNRKLTKVWFTENKIKKIPANFFNGLDDLEGVNFESNELTYLPALLFADNRNLKWMDFEKNEIEKLDPEIFSGLRHLQHRYFRMNPCVETRTVGDKSESSLQNCFNAWRRYGAPIERNHGE